MRPQGNSRAMAANTKSQEMAYHNALESIQLGISLPFNVFREVWKQFLFFDSDRVFDRTFVGVLGKLMEAEDSEVCCLINCGGGGTPVDLASPPAIHLKRSISPLEYLERLVGDRSPASWWCLVDRYVCATNVGDWCSYCEKQEEVAIIAFRETGIPDKFAAVVGALDALPISNLATQPSQGRAFKFDKVTPLWRDCLLEHYSL